MLFPVAALTFFCASLVPASAAPVPGVTSTWAFRENATWTYSHCSSFVNTSSGTLLSVFQATQSHEGGPTQTKFLVRSTDNGATWSAPKLLVSFTNSSGEELLPWDGTVFLDADARIRYVFFFSPYHSQSAGDMYTISSSDDGATWSAPSMVFSRSVWGRIMSQINPPVVLRDGSLALPVYTTPGDSGDHGPVTSGLVLVGGDGEQWTPKGVLPTSLINITVYQEPAVAVCAPPNDDQLLMLIRTGILELWAARSTDEGASWSLPYATPLQNPNSKVNLLQWTGDGAGGDAPAHGDLVLILNPFANCSAPSNGYCPRSPLSLSVSRDCGGSWGPLFDVEIDGVVDGVMEGSFGYPTGHQCTDADGEPAICITYSVGTNVTGTGGIRFTVVPAKILV